MNVVIIDFEDSFTFNIACELKEIGIESRVINHHDFSNNYQEYICSSNKYCLILGPGPGHPNEYKQCEVWIKAALEASNVFLMGICLGHQLIWKSLGAQVFQIEKPVHGVQVEIEFSDQMAKRIKLNSTRQVVQIYNSLEVHPSETHFKQYELCIHDKSLIAAMGEGFITYQFHPESIGTSYRSQYFSPVREFIL